MASTGQVTRGPLGIVTPQGGMDDGSDNGFLVGTRIAPTWRAIIKHGKLESPLYIYWLVVWNIFYFP